VTGAASRPPADGGGHIERNRAAWDDYAKDFVGLGELAWADEEPTWGIWSVPEAELHVLPDDIEGLDTIELGCGTAYVSAWLARRGARPVGIDLSQEQLATARRLQAEHGLAFPLIEGNAEQVPLPDASFDLAISEYGACLWADPYLWVPEAARLLRPGGRLIFLTNSVLLMLCIPDEADAQVGERLARDHFGLHRVEWPDEESVEFHLGHGDWFKLLRANGFAVDDLIEVRPGADSRVRARFLEDIVSLEWARRWPCEEIWKARKLG
jgi:SAM-dependent methyltransferase